MAGVEAQVEAQVEVQVEVQAAVQAVGAKVGARVRVPVTNQVHHGANPVIPQVVGEVRLQLTAIRHRVQAYPDQAPVHIAIRHQYQDCLDLAHQVFLDQGRIHIAIRHRGPAFPDQDQVRVRAVPGHGLVSSDQNRVHQDQTRVLIAIPHPGQVFPVQAQVLVMEVLTATPNLLVDFQVQDLLTIIILNHLMGQMYIVLTHTVQIQDMVPPLTIEHHNTIMYHLTTLPLNMSMFMNIETQTAATETY